MSTLTDLCEETTPGICFDEDPILVLTYSVGERSICGSSSITSLGSLTNTGDADAIIGIDSFHSEDSEAGRALETPHKPCCASVRHYPRPDRWDDSSMNPFDCRKLLASGAYKLLHD